MDCEVSECDFAGIKGQLLKTLNSSKDFVDTKISSLLEKINKQNDYFTAKSCPGKVIVSQSSPECHESESIILYSTYDNILTNDIINSLKDTKNVAMLIFEPFTLDIYARSMVFAKNLLNIAYTCGLKYSEIIFDADKNIIVMIRGSHLPLELPLLEGKFDNLESIVPYMNEMLTETAEEIKSFEESISKHSER